MIGQLDTRTIRSTFTTKFKELLTKNKWYILLIGIISTVFILLQCKQPYYFLQDDNRGFFLPIYVHNFRSIINNEFPVFNFHQFLGVPMLGNGQSGALYPVTYISVILSKLIFGHYFATIDIYVYIHLIIAGAGFFILLKSLELEDKASFFGAITWALSGFIIFASNSWAFISAFAALFPITVYYGVKLCRNINCRNLIMLVICQTLLFYIGSPQYFIYSMIFKAIILIALMLSEEKYRKDIKSLIKPLKIILMGYVCTVILCLPILLPTYCQMAVSFSRNSKPEYGEYIGIYYTARLLINSLLIPFRQIPNNFIHLDNIAHVGYFTLILALMSIIAIFTKKVSQKQQRYILIFYFIGIMSYIWTMDNIVARIIYFIPILNRMNDTVKVVLFANFCIIILAAIGFSICMREIGENAKKIFLILIFIFHVTNFLILYVCMPQQAFGIYADTIPKQDTVDYMFGNNRIVTLGFGLSGSFNDAYIYFNQATLRGIYQFSGYKDPLLPKENDAATCNLPYYGIYFCENDIIPLDYFRKWGVRWYITGVQGIPEKYKDDVVLKYEDNVRKIYYDAEGAPMLHWKESNSETGIDYQIKTNSIVINTDSGTDDNLNINFLYNPFFKAFIDGKRVPIAKDEYARMSVLVHGGQHNVLIKYCDPYFAIGCYAVIVSLVSAGVYGAFRISKNKNNISV